MEHFYFGFLGLRRRSARIVVRLGFNWGAKSIILGVGCCFGIYFLSSVKIKCLLFLKNYEYDNVFLIELDLTSPG